MKMTACIELREIVDMPCIASFRWDSNLCVIWCLLAQGSLWISAQNLVYYFHPSSLLVETPAVESGYFHNLDVSLS
jgi:hypothetical protein